MNADSTKRYGTVSRIFHWGMAALIGWQALKVFDRIADGEPAQLLNLHPPHPQ